MIVGSEMVLTQSQWIQTYPNWKGAEELSGEMKKYLQTLKKSYHNWPSSLSQTRVTDEHLLEEVFVVLLVQNQGEFLCDGGRTRNGVTQGQ